MLKIWNSGGPGLDFERLKQRIEDRADYDLADLRNLVRRDYNLDLDKMIRQAIEGFRFLHDLTNVEKVLAADQSQRRRAEATALAALIVQSPLPHTGPSFRL